MGAYLDKTPATSRSKKQANLNIGQLSQLLQEHRQLAYSYMEKLPPAVREGEQTRLITQMIMLEVSYGDIDEDYGTTEATPDLYLGPHEATVVRPRVTEAP